MRKTYEKIKRWWDKLRGKDDTLTLYHNPNTQPMYVMSVDEKWQNSLTLTGPSGDEIFLINVDGTAKWLKEDSYNEAAEIFLSYVTWGIESKAGVKQSRMDWEKSIAEALVHAAEERGGSLRAEELTDVVRKCIMYDKLKGKYGSE